MTSQRLMPALVLAAAVLTACSAGNATPQDPGPRFDDQGQAEISCMQHQPAAAGPRYRDVERRNTGEVLAVLRYYTANGRKPYCDNSGPTETDRSWARLYVEFGAEATNVEPLVGGG